VEYQRKAREAGGVVCLPTDAFQEAAVSVALGEVDAVGVACNFFAYSLSLTRFVKYGNVDDLAVCDWNADGKNDLCIGAIWNMNSKGVLVGGQLILYVGPTGEHVQAVQRHVFEDNLTSAEDKIVRWGMPIDARHPTIMVGSPRWSPPGKPRSWQSGRLMIMQRMVDSNET
jgi:hypothetical protein